MKKKRSTLAKSLAAPKKKDSSLDDKSGWGFIKEIQDKSETKKILGSAIDRNNFGSLKNMTSFQVIQIMSMLNTANAGDGDANCANCYNCANCVNCSDDGN